MARGVEEVEEVEDLEAKEGESLYEEHEVQYFIVTWFGQSSVLVLTAIFREPGVGGGRAKDGRLLARTIPIWIGVGNSLVSSLVLISQVSFAGHHTTWLSSHRPVGSVLSRFIHGELSGNGSPRSNNNVQYPGFQSTYSQARFPRDDRIDPIR